jgi:phenylpropionate dioxygenase-like ring-hydroxylating dioxygenase large terminal subunit
MSALEEDGGQRSESAPLAPLRTKNRYSVVRLPGQWFVLATSEELGRDRPLARTLMGTPLVLFRDAQGRAATLLDRCPHRNVPLSIGKVAKDGTLECGYHGWRFDGGGACRAIPSFTGTAEGKARSCPSYPTIEQQGFVWAYSSAGDMPSSRPHRFEYVDDPAYITVRQQIDLGGTMYSAIENALDVPHTAFLHRGLFRSESRGVKLLVKVSRTKDRCVAEYVGEPRPPGFMAMVLSPSGGVVSHWDRFILPSIAQVEYKIGTENHIMADTAMTPITDFETRLYGVVSFKTRLPARAIGPFVTPVAMRVLKQDAYMLKKQTETITAFGGEQFASTEIDVLGKHIWRLLRAAERGSELPPDESTEVDLVV